MVHHLTEDIKLAPRTDHHNRLSRLAQRADLRDTAEAMLCDIAFVLSCTARVRQSMADRGNSSR